MEIKKILSIIIYLILIISCKPKEEYSYYVSKENYSELYTLPKEEVTNVKWNIYKYKDTLYLGSDYFQKRIDEKSEKRIINEKKGIYLHKYVGKQNVSTLIDEDSYKELIKDLLYVDDNNVYVFPKGNGCYLCLWTLDLDIKEIKIFGNTYIKDNKKVYCLINGKEIKSVNAIKFNTYTTDNKIIFGYDDKNFYHSCEQIKKEDLKYFGILEKDIVLSNK